MRSNSHILRARSQRRMQLETMDHRKINAICDTPIATAEAILSLPSPSPTLRGTCAKQLSEAMASLSGFKGAPTRKMKSLVTKLCPPGRTIPYATLPPMAPGEELIELARDVVKAMPHLRGHQAKAISSKLLRLLDQFFPTVPAEIRKVHQTLQKFVPDYVPSPDFLAQFQDRRTLSEQLAAIDREYLYRQAVALFDAKPAGHA